MREALDSNLFSYFVCRKRISSRSRLNVVGCTFSPASTHLLAHSHAHSHHPTLSLPLSPPLSPTHTRTHAHPRSHSLTITQTQSCIFQFTHTLLLAYGLTHNHPPTPWVSDTVDGSSLRYQIHTRRASVPGKCRHPGV